MSRPGDLDGLSHAELKGLVVKQWEEMVELQRMVVALRDEIARLKGGSGRPNIKPSGMEQATEPKPPGSSGDQRRGRGSTRSKLSIHEERTVKVGTPNADVRVLYCLDRCHISSSGCGFLPMEQRIFAICQPSCASVHAGSDFIASTWQADMPMNGCSVGTVTWHD